MSKKKVIIYGVSHQAKQLKAYLEEEGAAEVCAFTVDREYKKEDRLLGLPVYEFEGIECLFPPEGFEVVLSFGYRNMIKNREEKFHQCKRKGYTIYTYISKNALVYTRDIGEGSLIYPACFIAPFTRIGKGCFLENGTSIAHDTILDNFVFCAPRANICGDVMIESNCFLGAGCVVAGIAHLKKRTLVSAGAVLLKDTEEAEICFPQKSVILGDKTPENYI